MCQQLSARYPRKAGLLFGLGGLGATPVQTAVSSGGAAAGLIAGAVIGGPVGALVGGAISVTAGAISSLFTPDYTKIYASNDANLAAQQLQTNLNGWNNLPLASKVPAVQQFFEQNYETVWNGLVQGCSAPSLGVAGQNCISQREPGGPYPFATYYLNPIQNDSSVHAQTADVTFTDPLTGTNITVTAPAASVASLASSTVVTDLENLLFPNGAPNWVTIGGAALVLYLVVKKL